MQAVTHRPRSPRTLSLRVMMALSGLSLFVCGSASAADIKLNISAIGRPPIFSTTYADLGERMGLFKAVGLDPTFRWFQRGADVARAIVTGDVSIGLTAAGPSINLIAAGAPVVAVGGMPNSDFFVASSDPGVKSCNDLKDRTVAADGINNARWLYLRALLHTCGLKLGEVKTINVANAPLVKASIAGQVKTAVFHIDELAQVEFQTKHKWVHIPTPEALEKSMQYTMLLASKKAIADDKEGIVRFLEAWILTQKMMSSRSAANRVVFATSAAKSTGDDFQVALNAIKNYQAIHYWVNNAGLPKSQVMSQVDTLVKLGTVKPAQKPTYDRIADRSLYAEAMRRVEAKFGNVGAEAEVTGSAR